MVAKSHWPLTLLGGGASIASVILPFALARMLSVDEMGIYKILSLYLMLSPAVFLISGLQSALPLSFQASSRERFQLAILRASFIAALLSAVLLIALAAADLGPAVLNLPSHLVAWLGIAIAPMLVGMVMEEALILEGEVTRAGAFAALGHLLRASLILGAVWIQPSATSVVQALILGGLIRMVLGFFWLKLSVKLLLARLDQKLPWRQYVLPISVSAVAGFLFLQFDQLTLSHLLSKEAFAIYSIGCLAFPPLQILADSIARVTLPALSQGFADRSPESVANAYARAVEQTAWIAFPLAIGLSITSSYVIPILYGESYRASAPIFSIFALTYLCLSFPLDWIARASGRGGRVFWITSLSALLVLISVSLGIHFAGTLGAVSGMVIGQLTARALFTFESARFLKLSVTKLIPFGALAQVSAACAFAALATVLLRSSAQLELVPGLVASLTVFGVVYVLSLFTLRKWNRPTGFVANSSTVLELTQFSGPGGLERQAELLSRTLRNGSLRVLEVSYDVAPGSPPPDSPTRWNKGAGFSLKSVLRIALYCARDGVSTIHTHDAGAMVYGGLAKLLVPHRIHWVHTQHSLLGIEPGGSDRRWFEWLIQKPDRMTAVATEVLEGLKRMGRKDAELTPNGILTPSKISLTPRSFMELRKRLCPEAADDPGAIWVLNLARIHPGKGQDQVLKRWKELPASLRKRAHLIFVGPATGPQFFETCRQLWKADIEPDRIHFLGATREPESWLTASDVLISLSESEGLPLSVLEACAKGLELVLSPIAGHMAFFPHADQTLSRSIERVPNTLEARQELRIRRTAERQEFIRPFLIESQLQAWIRILSSR